MNIDTYSTKMRLAADAVEKGILSVSDAEQMYGIRFSSTDKLKYKIGPDKYEALVAHNGFYDARHPFKPQYSEWAQYMIQSANFVSCEKGSFVFESTHYRHISQSEIEHWLAATTLGKGKPTHSAMFIKTLMAESYRESQHIQPPAGMLNLRNGTLDLKTGKLTKHGPGHFFTYCIPNDFDPDATCSGWIAFLERIFPGAPEFKIICASIFGYILYGGDPWLHKSFVLHGEGRNGKSTFLYILQKLIGKENYSSVSLSNIHKPFSVYPLTHALANIAGESPTDKINAEAFKEASSGGMMTASRKYEDEYTFECRTRFIFACNELPRFGENTIGMQERLYFIPFRHFFTEQERNADVKYELEKELSGILNWAIAGLQNLLDEKRLPVTDASNILMDTYNCENDAVYAWAKENIAHSPAGSATKSKVFYQRFRGEISGIGRHPVADYTFYKRLKKYLKSQSWFIESEMYNANNRTYRQVVFSGESDAPHKNQFWTLN